VGPSRQREGGVGCVPLQGEALLGQGRFGGWAKMAPLAFSYFFFLFLFLFSDLFNIFCKNASIQFKQIPKFF
jgi:hypothetical protein